MRGRTVSSPWTGALAPLGDARCQGLASLQLHGALPFYDESSLPFTLAGGGSVWRLVPQRGFRKESLAATGDERSLLVDCPDDEGWLVPDGVVRDWLARHVQNEQLEDLLLSHPLYEHLTRSDVFGHSRGGTMPLVQWTPAIPHFATVIGPEFLPGDKEAPTINRERAAYAHAVDDLLARIAESFALVEVELGFKFDVAGT